MKKSFLFKRGDYYHLEYLDEYENRIKRISTGCRKKSEAMDFLRKFEEKKSPAIKPILLKQFFELYKDHVKTNLSLKYLKDIQTTESKLLEFAGNIPLAQITSILLDKFITHVAKDSKHQSIKHYNNLRSAFNKANVWGYMETNPILKIRPVKVPKNNPLFINEVELESILEEERDDKLKDAYKFAFHTGMRLGEIVNLKWDAVNLNDKIIRIVNTDSFTTKGKEERVIPINDKLFNVLIKRLPKVITINRDLPVFNKNGFKLNADYISKRFKKALKQTELNDKLHFHDLRHSFASNLAMKGVPLYTIMELLGHKEIKTTQIYSHLKVENLRDAVKVLEY